MYRGNGAGGWATGTAEPVGSGWAGFTALAVRRRLQRRRQARRPRAPRRRHAAALPRQRRERLGHRRRRADRQRLERTELPHARAPAPPPPAPPGARAAAARAGRPAARRQHLARPPGSAARRPAGCCASAEGPPPRRAARRRGCTGRLLRARRPAPHRPPRARTPCACASTAPRASRGRVYARVYYRRAGSKTLHTKTVSRRFVMCAARRAGRSAPRARGGVSRAWRSSASLEKIAVTWRSTARSERNSRRRWPGWSGPRPSRRGRCARAR